MKLELCPFCKNLPGTKVGPPALARCVTSGCLGKDLGAETFPAWNKRASIATSEPHDDQLYQIRDLIASHICCESDCQKMPNGCGCALTAARAVLALTRPARGGAA